MMEKWEVTMDELKELMGEEKSVTQKDYCMMVTVAFLLGMVLGIFFSPKKHVEFASNNVTMEGTEVTEKDRKKIEKCCRKRNKKEEQEV